MRSPRWLLVSVFGSLLLAASSMSCGSDPANNGDKPTCSDGIDNDGDGAIDFPDDSGCKNESDEEDDIVPPQCDDGRDNDGDGKHDYPNDPGCFAPNQDSEEDDCPDGPQCPQCSNGKDDDMNGQTDYPEDSGGCTDASDNDEYTRNPVACGGAVHIERLPQDGHIKGMIDPNAPSSLTSMTCGGGGSETAYEIRITQPKIVVATSDSANTAADTVLYIRSADCQNPANEVACNDDISTSNKKSSITKSISTPGTYYLVVDAHDSASAGAFDVQVTFLAGEGTECAGPTDCGPGLVCRLPKNGTAKVCSKHVCEDNVDEDGDGKNGYPDDPGCTTPTDDDESDSCPGVGPNCPECADGVDNDMDMKIDFGPNGDATCTSASSASESCVSTDGVQQIIGPATPGTTVGAVNDTKPACGSSTATAGDHTYRIDVPAMADLTLDADNMTQDGVVALYNATCGGTAIQCKDTPETVTVTNLAAGTYYFVVDGYSTGVGTYTINTSGHIQNGASCESPLVTAGAITCSNGYACKGTAGSRTCQPAACSDGISNNDDDTIADFPFDPGCSSPADDDETNPTTLPICADNVDNDMDNMKDYPADLGCNGAGGASEVFCTGETDLTSIAAVTTKTITGDSTGKANDWATTTCISSSGPDVAYALQLPVPVQSLQIDTIGSQFDTVIQIRDIACAAQMACDDEGGGSGTSKMTLTNLSAGSYAIIVDGWLGDAGAYTLNVRGTVATGTPCGFPLFTGGANAVLVCPTGTTCTGTPAKCQ